MEIKEEKRKRGKGKKMKKRETWKKKSDFGPN